MKRKLRSDSDFAGACVPAVCRVQAWAAAWGTAKDGGQSEDESWFGSLSNDILELIFGRLGVADRMSNAGVCRRWCAVAYGMAESARAGDMSVACVRWRVRVRKRALTRAPGTGSAAT